MPHNAGAFIIAHILPRAIAARPATVPITYYEAVTVEDILRDDAQEYFYSATVSTAGALSSLSIGHYSWATVKLYYSSFYLLRGILALTGLCLFYEGTKPRTLLAVAGAGIGAPGGRRSSTTHGLVIEEAKKRLTGAALSQDIDGQNPLDWIRQRREDANYAHAKFPEPEAPRHLQFCSQHGVRKLLTSYLDDKNFTYTFDPDHAMISYNLLLWQELRRRLVRLDKFDLSDQDVSYLQSLFIDRNGPLTMINRLIGP